jgi:hypothetical protein
LDENRCISTRKIFENMKMHLIASARPNIMKTAPLCHVLKREVLAELWDGNTAERMVQTIRSLKN